MSEAMAFPFPKQTLQEEEEEEEEEEEASLR